MSEHGQIFAYFPGQRETKLLIDITKIEAIEQSPKPEYATIHTGSQQYYVCVEDPLGDGVVDAMGYITMQIGLASEAAEHAEQESDGESDEEDDFNLNDFVDLPRPEALHLAAPGPTEHDCDRSGCND